LNWTFGKQNCTLQSHMHFLSYKNELRASTKWASERSWGEVPKYFREMGFTYVQIELFYLLSLGIHFNYLSCNDTMCHYVFTLIIYPVMIPCVDLVKENDVVGAAYCSVSCFGLLSRYGY
jgi:hypothetical protein